MVVAMILAGGVGTRVGAKIPKQFIEVAGRPVIAYTIDIFEYHDEIDAIEIVCHKEWKDYLNKVIQINNYKKVKWVVDGGSDFQQSVMNGLYNFNNQLNENDFIMIHYAASPFTSHEIVSDVIKVAKEKGSAFSATPCFQLMGTNDGDSSDKWIDRDDYIQIASPYAFPYMYLREVYKRAMKRDLLDKVEPHVTTLIQKLGDPLYQAMGSQLNIKITTEDDLKLLYLIVEARKHE